MDKTKHYQLNQWAAGDKVQRIDFNADNAKIDAALRTNADAIDAEATARDKAVAAEVSARTAAVAALEDKAALHTIKTVSYPQSKTGAAVFLNDIDWTAWKIVVAVIHAEMDSGTCRLYPMGSRDDHTALIYSNDIMAVLFPMRRSDLPFAGLLLAESGKAFSFGDTYQNARGFSLSPTSSQTLLRATATVYGMK
ncbi:hypothetical protein D7V91_14230 [bacterium 1xD42-67]|nr:hypothetical protein D7V91_14230 [bacterium 1xD42-67]